MRLFVVYLANKTPYIIVVFFFSSDSFVVWYGTGYRHIKLGTCPQCVGSEKNCLDPNLTFQVLPERNPTSEVIPDPIPDPGQNQTFQSSEIRYC